MMNAKVCIIGAEGWYVHKNIGVVFRISALSFFQGFGTFDSSVSKCH